LPTAAGSIIPLNSDRIVGVQQVTEDRLDRGLHRLVVEIEGDGATRICGAGVNLIDSVLPQWTACVA